MSTIYLADFAQSSIIALLENGAKAYKSCMHKAFMQTRQDFWSRLTENFVNNPCAALGQTSFDVACNARLLVAIRDAKKGGCPPFHAADTADCHPANTG
ncbi:hypothetical protein [Burkholderia sp. Ac-20379]|uniref:hypothetical protein n=1 Tax=Burkholderia sp. Ac-20379 TaxID=2703900 RepID=UPI0019824A72|nr:hypothetical protein [Burkholderia sp. Ac-20379]MBN3723212.1 hypothetical protein [Burkholderia sp. Ac-20379]